VVLVTGKVSNRDQDEEDPPIFLDRVELLEDAVNSGRLAVVVELRPNSELDPSVFEQVRTIVGEHPGNSPLELQVGADNGAPAPRLRSRELRLRPNAEVVAALQEIFGVGRVRVVKRTDAPPPAPRSTEAAAEVPDPTPAPIPPPERVEAPPAHLGL